ncbi:MAG: hypothetical protein JWP25_6907 [Bradyrhizobium sp.]|jgi:hypothetical protein|nr:hypothetical protein [Bradyrhizobium sp.]
MLDRSGNLIAPSRMLAATAAAAISALMIAAGSAWPQAAPPPPSLGVQEPIQQAAPDRAAPPQGEVVPSPAPPAREENPGLINEIGKMFGKLPSLKSPSETIDDWNARAKDTAKDANDTLSRLAKPLMVTGRTICPVSTNGAPDCKTASDKLCQTKGFKEGKSLTADSAETCSAKVLIPGRTRKPDDCRTDTYVTRALCQ